MKIGAWSSAARIDDEARLARVKAEKLDRHIRRSLLPRIREMLTGGDGQGEFGKLDFKTSRPAVLTTDSLTVGQPTLEQDIQLRRDISGQWLARRRPRG